MPWQHLTPGKDPVPIVQGAGWAPGPVWTGAENLTPPGFDPRTVQPIGSPYTDYTTRPDRMWAYNNTCRQQSDQQCAQFTACYN